ncbi:MAG: hypothetical protein V4710_11060 [Verrucomicrobiota bacterium]
MTLAEFKQFLIDEVDDGETAWVRALLKAAREKVQAGGGMIAPMTSAGANGKTFSKAIEFNCVEVAAACRAALKFDDQGGGVITVPNFGGR